MAKNVLLGDARASAHNYYNADIITNNSVGKFDSAFFAENVIKHVHQHECVERNYYNADIMKDK